MEHDAETLAWLRQYETEIKRLEAQRPSVTELLKRLHSTDMTPAELENVPDIWMPQ